MSKIHIIYIKGKIYRVREKEKQSKISHSQKNACQFWERKYIQDLYWYIPA